MMGAKGRVSSDDRSFDRAFWSSCTPEERVEAIFDLRELYHEVMHPEIGSKGLDRTIGGTRRRGD
jgi:hypothetical protein